jgi:hypothetical protein
MYYVAIRSYDMEEMMPWAMAESTTDNDVICLDPCD